MELVLQNPQASAPLRLAIDLACNTPKEKIFANVLENSKDRKRKWVSPKPAHERVAVVVGSGPSAADFTRELQELYIDGVDNRVDFFALNGAARWMNVRNMLPDFQVILDARPETIQLVSKASTHLFASQVDPSLFDFRPEAWLWHATFGEELPDEQPGFDPAERDYCLIGAASSVGATVLPLLFALGYRRIKLYGMDSSNRGDSTHLLPQPLNDNDVYTFVEFLGKTYTSSLTMRSQAGWLMDRCRRLKRDGCEIEVFGDGLFQAMWRADLSEQAKYVEMWQHAEYRLSSPGERAAADFIDLLAPGARDHVVDLGCGTGRGGAAIHSLVGARITLVDFVEAVDKDIELTFEYGDLSSPLRTRGDFVYCTDVLEHIPHEQVDTVILNAMEVAPTAFFQISLVEDSMGLLIGQELHLSVHPCQWWVDAFTRLGFKVTHHCDKGDFAQYIVTHHK